MTLTKIDDRGLKYPIELLNNEKIRLGEGNNRLEALHNGSHSRVAHSGVGKLIITASTVELNNGANTETMLKAVQDGAVLLYYDNTLIFETINGGARVNGVLHVTSHLDMGDSDIIKLGDGDDLQIKFNGTDSIISHDTGSGLLRLNAAAGGEIHITKSGPETLAKFIPDGAVELYHDNSKKFETYTAGVSVTGTLTVGTGNIVGNDNAKLKLGTSDDLQIYHNGTSSEIVNATGALRLHGAQNQAIIFRNHDDTANVAVFNVDDATHLYFDSAHKFSTNSTGIRVVGNCIPGSNDSGQLGTSSIRWQELNITDVIDVSDNGKIRMGDSDDLQIYHDGNNSAINDKGTGSLYIQGSNNIYLRDYDTSENHIVMTKDGSVDLYHNGSKKFETTSGGTKTTGYHQQTAIPSFLAEHKNSDTHKTSSDIKNQFVRSFGTVRHNTGNHFSNSTGKFTAPVAGLYMFTMSMTFDKGDGVDDSAGCYFRVENNSGNYNRVHSNGRDFWNINARFFTRDGSEISQSFQTIELLDANATVGFYFTDFDDTTSELTVAFFSGHLIG